MKNLLLSFVLLATLGLSNAIAQTTFINEDFESYSAGTFPSSGGWVLQYNGSGDSYQIVTNTQAHSGTKCMQLKGTVGWTASMYKPLSQTPGIVFFEAYMMTTSSSPSYGGELGFQTHDEGTWGTYYASAGFTTSDSIGVYLGNNPYYYVHFYNINQWYKVKIKYDYPNNLVSIWINDTLKAANLVGNFSTNGYHDFYMVESSGSYFYIDDIKVCDFDPDITNCEVDEDFESYSAGTFPSSGGWVLQYNGAGDSYQIVTNTQAHSGTKCMQLKGTVGWTASMYKPLSQTPGIVFFEAYMMTTSSSPSYGGELGFQTHDEGTWGTYYASAGFTTSDSIGVYLGNNPYHYVHLYNINQWYKVKIKYDYPNNLVNIWINDTLKAVNLVGNFSTNGYHDFYMVESSGSYFYIDDIKVCDQDPDIIGFAEITKINDEINIYPNPANDKITIVSTINKNTEISIYNIQGQIMIKQPLKHQSTEINISNLSKGLYFICVVGKERIAIKKFIKE